MTYKWPVKECTRCGGSGRYSYNQIDGDRCYGCGGTGVQYANKAVAQIVADYRDATRRARQPVANDLQPGDVVIAGLRSSKSAGDQWVTVTAVEITDEVCGWSGPDRTPTSWRMIVTTDDGETRTISGNQIVRRRVDMTERQAAAVAAARLAAGVTA